MNSNFSIKTFENLGFEIEIPYNTEQKYLASNTVTAGFKTFFHHALEINIATSIKQKAINNYITFTCADKSNTVIAKKESEYIQKNKTFVERRVFQILKKNSTVKYLRQIKSLLENASIFPNVN